MGKHGDAVLRDIHICIAGRAFKKDKLMIEAQKEMIDQMPTQEILLTTAGYHHFHAG
jgi:hypothetical protein